MAMDFKAHIDEVCQRAKESSAEISNLSTEIKNKMLSVIAGALVKNADYILTENQKDISLCQKPKNFLDRLSLSLERIASMAEGVSKVIDLDDPVGISLESWTNVAGLLIERVSVPLGVVGIIYEARPNVTVDVAALSLKSGNVVVLRGGSDALNSNRALVEVIKAALIEEGYPYQWIQLIEDTSREGAQYLMTRNQYIDVLIPRGGGELIKSVVNNATIPVIETGTGNCHIYIERTADIDMAVNIILNAKTQRTSVCNAAESLLIDRALSPRVAEILAKLTEAGVQIKGDSEVVKLYNKALPATEQDYYAEYLGLVISCKLVDGFNEAIAHINKYGTHHSDCIITKDEAAAQAFTKSVDSAAVYVNASTRFTDGFEFGFGAEMGISTQKLHARGPVGLRELTSYKYVVRGTGQIRG